MIQTKTIAVVLLTAIATIGAIDDDRKTQQAHAASLNLHHTCVFDMCQVTHRSESSAQSFIQGNDIFNQHTTPPK